MSQKIAPLDTQDSFVTADGRTIGPAVMEMQNITLALAALSPFRTFPLISVKAKSERLSDRMVLANPLC